GVGGSARVALMLPNGAEYLIAQQALARLGANAVQIGYRLKANEVGFILENSEPAAVIVHADFLDVMREARAATGQRGPMLVVGEVPDSITDVEEWDRALAAASPDLPPRVQGGDGGGVIVYTSGTTGKPKGAHRAWNRTGFQSVADMIYQVGMHAD